MKITKILALGCLIGVVPFPNVLFGQDSKLVDAAKKEGGKVVVYGSLENDTMDLIAAALKRKPGWKRITGEKRLTKLQIESPMSPGPEDRSLMSC